MDNRYHHFNINLTNAVISGNTEALTDFFKKLAMSGHSDESQDEIALFYDHLKLMNIPVSRETDLLFQEFLLDTRFYNKNTRNHLNFDELTDYIKATQETINELKNLNENDCKFLFYIRHIVESICVLKRHLRSTYQEIPWEEMEFCLAMFINTITNSKNSDLFYKLTFTRQQILEYLAEFGYHLFMLQTHMTPNDLRKVSVTGREKYVKNISLKSETFRRLYDDYEFTRNIFSLSRVQTYLNLALSERTNPKDFTGKLILQRTLQVTGECLKCTPTSPNVSPKVQRMLVSSAPKNLKEITSDVRLYLSHANSLFKKVCLEETGNEKFFESIQLDLKKIEVDICYVLYKVRLDGVKMFLQKIINAKNWDCISHLREKFDELDDSEFDSDNFENPFLKRLQSYVCEIKQFLGKTDEETECKFRNISEIFESLETKVKELKTKYKSESAKVIAVVRSIKYAKNISHVRDMAQNCLLSITPDDQLKSVNKILDIINSIFHNRKDIPIALYTQIHSMIEFEFNRIERINEFKDAISQDLVESTVEDVLKGISENFNSEDTLKLFLNEAEKKKIRHIAKQRLKGMRFDNPDGFKEFNEITSSFGIKERRKLKTLMESKQYDECLVLIQKIDDSYQALLSDLSEKSVFSLNRYKKSVRNFVASIKVTKDTLSIFQVATEQHLLNIEILLKKQYKGRLDLLRLLLKESTKNELIIDDWKTTVVEMILLDLMEILENLDLFDDTKLFLEQYSPVLVGKNLRNYLAHGDAYLETFPLDPKIGLICNAYKLIEIGVQIMKSGNMMIGGCQYVSSRKRLEMKREWLWEIHQTFLSIKEGVYIEDGVNINDKMRNYLLENGLHVSAKFNNLEAFKYFCKFNKLEATDVYGNEAIVVAASFGSLDILKYLLSERKLKDINCKYQKNKTLLHFAIKNNQIDTVKFLLNNKIKIEEDPEFIRIVHIAALNNNVVILQLLLEEGIDVNCRYSKGLTPLHSAAFSGSLEAIDLLLKHGAIIDAKHLEHRTPLYEALMSKEEEAVILLLSRGADVKFRDDIGLTPLHLAMTIGNVRIVKALLELGADVNSSDEMGNNVLHFAANFQFAEAIEIFIENGANVHKENNSGETALHYAALHANPKCAEILVRNGAVVDKPGLGLVTPLHIAAENGNEIVAEFLIKSNANIEAVDEFLCTPLYKAAENNNLNVLKLLLKFGANINARNIHKWIPLHVATSYGYKEIVNNLLSSDLTEFCAKTTSGWTALHVAALAGLEEITSELLTKSYTLDQLREDDGRTPLHFAALENKTNIAKLLLDKFFLTDIGDICGRTALHLACQKGHLAMVVFLLDKKANVNAEDNEGFTPLHFAAKYGHKNVVLELLKHKADPTAVSKNKLTPSHMAVFTCRINVLKLLPISDSSVLHQAMHAECVEFLLDNFKLDVNVRSEIGRTPLHKAALTDNTGVMKALIDKGAVVDEVDPGLDTPLLLATKVAAKNSVELLLKHGASVNITNCFDMAPLHYACINNSIECLTLLLQHEINIDKRMDFGLTALHVAAIDGHKEMALMLIANGATIDAKDDFSATPLFRATENSNDDIIKILLDKGADCKFQNRDGRTPLHVAVNKNLLTVVDLLLKKDSESLKLKDICSNNPLHTALINSFKEMTLKILRNECAVEICNEKGYKNYTPLQIAAKNGDVEICEILLEMGAKTVDRSDYASVLHSGVSSGKLDLVVKIMERVPNHQKEKVLCTVDNDGDSPLMWAVEIGATDIVEYLLKIGADPFQANTSGINTFGLANTIGNNSLCEVLERWKINRSVAAHNK